MRLKPRGARQGVPMFFDPALNVGNVGYSGRQAKKNEDDHAVKIVTHSSRIAWVLDFSEGIGEGGQKGNLGIGVGIHRKTSVFYVF